VTEWKLFDTEVAHVSTAEFHRDRERAPHLEQEFHRPRLERARDFIVDLWDSERPNLMVSDLGCGDGGLLKLLPLDLPAWGYDFTPANVRAATEERLVAVRLCDVFGADWRDVVIGGVVVLTEVLEHLTNPRQVLGDLVDRGARWIIASSPVNETAAEHAPEHAWAWDFDGYAELFINSGWRVDKHETLGYFQIIQASRKR